MNKVIITISILLLPMFLYPKDVLPIPVRYNPFLKAKKLIIKKENIQTFKVKKKRKIVKKRVVEKLPVLVGIFNKKAFIDGKIYKVGEKIKGYRVVAINDDNVFLKKWGRTVILPLVDKRRAVYTKEER